MIPYIRRKSILEFMHQKEIVYIDEITEKVNVSIATVRRDLKTLADENQIELLKGGAARLKQTYAEKSLIEKLDLNKGEKELIGGYAATLVNDGQFIFIGPGTTENWIIKHLKDKDIIVVTNGTYHIEELRKHNIQTVILGGEVKNSIAVITGNQTYRQIKNMIFDKCFIGCSGYTLKLGASTSDSGVSEINKIAIANSKEVYIIADSTKLGQDSRYLFTNAEIDFKVITTSLADDKYKDENAIIIVD
ncbi:MAG: DeoR/GlpR family DNA-binding transcription regulator [Candidatus Izemoplasma sp.]